MTTCRVTLTTFVRRGRSTVRPICDQPVVKHGLCAKHYADRLRLGGGL